MAENVILAEQTLDGFAYNQSVGSFMYSGHSLVTLQEGEIYRVLWDGEQHNCVAYSYTQNGYEAIFIGNEAIIKGENTDVVEPFIIYQVLSNGYNVFVAMDTQTSHTVAIYQVEAEPEEPVGIVIRNYSGTPVTYPGVEKVMFTTSDGGTQIFSKGEAVENIPIAVDFSDGDQVITAPDGTLVKSAIIQKPDTLTPDNIKLGVSIAGVDGEYMTESEDVTVPLAMADGDMVIVPTEGKLLASVTVQKPETLIPENIAEGVEIAGVVGTHSGGGGGGGDFDASDENLKYFAYQLDSENKTITLFTILYSAIYADTGSYDVTIPDTLGGYKVVVATS